MAAVIKVLCYLAALAASPQVLAAPCGEKPECPPEYGIEAQKIQDVYLNAQSEHIKSRIDEIIISSTHGGNVDWIKAYKQFNDYTSGPLYKAITEQQNAIYIKAAQDKQIERDQKMIVLMRYSENLIRSQLKDPSSAIIEWNGQFTDMNFKPNLLAKRVNGFGGCGYVNAKNSFGGYVGIRRFVVIFKDINGGLLYSSIDSGNDFDFTELQCSKISFRPIKEGEVEKSVALTGNESISGQLETLVRLRDSGALTSAEFDRAKAKLLGSD